MRLRDIQCSYSGSRVAKLRRNQILTIQQTSRTGRSSKIQGLDFYQVRCWSIVVVVFRVELWTNHKSRYNIHDRYWTSERTIRIYKEKHLWIETLSYVGGLVSMWLGLSAIRLYDFILWCAMKLFRSVKKVTPQAEYETKDPKDSKEDLPRPRGNSISPKLNATANKMPPVST